MLSQNWESQVLPSAIVHEIDSSVANGVIVRQGTCLGTSESHHEGWTIQARGSGNRDRSNAGIEEGDLETQANDGDVIDRISGRADKARVDPVVGRLNSESGLVAFLVVLQVVSAKNHNCAQRSVDARCGR